MLQLTLKLSGPAPKPTSFAIDDPARISVDLPGTQLALASRRIDVRSGGLDTILAAQTPDKGKHSWYWASYETKEVLASPPVLETRAQS